MPTSLGLQRWGRIAPCAAGAVRCAPAQSREAMDTPRAPSPGAGLPKNRVADGEHAHLSPGGCATQLGAAMTAARTFERSHRLSDSFADTASRRTFEIDSLLTLFTSQPADCPGSSAIRRKGRTGTRPTRSGGRAGSLQGVVKRRGAPAVMAHLLKTPNSDSKASTHGASLNGSTPGPWHHMRGAPTQTRPSSAPRPAAPRLRPEHLIRGPPTSAKF